MKAYWVVGLLLLLTMGEAHAKTTATMAPTWSYNTTNVQHHPSMDGVRYARTRHKRPRFKTKQSHPRAPRAVPAGSDGLATVPTAAGVTITVAKNLVGPFKGFIEDLVKDGYTPKHIGCWAPVGTHVAHSNHYHGGACDFDQTGRNRTAKKMYHVRDLAAKWGLRDGCSFRDPDCGHIDDGSNVGWRFPHPNLIARYIDWKNTPVQRQKNDLTPFEE